MSGTLGNLSVVLTLDDAGFTVGIIRATAAASKLQGAVDGLQRSIAGTNSTFGAASSAASSWGQSVQNAAAAAQSALASATAAMASAMQQQVQATQQATTALTSQLSMIQNVQAAASKGATFNLSGGSSGLTFNASSLAALATGLLGIGTAAGLMGEGLKLADRAFDGAITQGDRMTASLNQLQAVTGSSRDAAATMYDQITAAAIRTGTATSDLSHTTVQLLTALTPLGQTPEQVLKIATTLAQLQAVSGTSAGAATRAIRELIESLSEGTAQLRQLQVLSRDDPALFSAMAKALHTTAGGLMEMASAGKLTATTMVDMLNTMGVNVEKTFNSVPRTLEQSRTSLSDSLSKLAADLDHTLGGSKTLAAWDRMWAGIAQSLDHAVDGSIGPKLAEANREVATFQAQLAKPTTATAFGLPDDRGEIRAQLAQAIAYRDALQRQADAQNSVSDATAKLNKAAAEQAAVIDAAQKAMAALGLEHGKAESSQQGLTSAIAAGGDAMVNYNGGLIHASELLSALAAKASPAAEAIAGLNAELVKANAADAGGLQSRLTDALLKADPLDTTGRGVNLSADQRNQIQAGVNALVVAQGQKDVQAAMDKLHLAQAAALGRSRHDGGLAENLERARQQRATFIRDHGNSPAAVSEADQISSADTQAARLTASSTTTAAQAKPVDNFITELKEKIAGFKATIDDADAAEAKFLSRIATTQALKGHSAQMTALVHQYEEFKREAELAGKANEANQKVQGYNQTATDALASFQVPDGLYHTDLQKEYLKNSQEINKQIAILQKAIQGGAYNSSAADLATANQRLAYDQATLQKMNDASLEASFDAMQREISTDRLANRNDGGKDELMELSAQQGDYKKGIGQLFDDGSLGAGQNALDKKKQLETELASWVQLKQADILNANKDQLQKTADEWGDWEKMLTTDANSMFGQLANAFEETGKKGSKAWTDIGNSAIKMIEDLTMKLAGSQLLTLVDQLWTGKGANGQTGIAGTAAGGTSTGGLGGLLTASGGLSGILTGLGKSLLPGLFGPSQATLTSNITSSGDIMAAYGHHAGGLAGGEPTFMRNVPANLFSGALRYHTDGLAGDEVPAILQQGEGVFTKGQMAAMGMQSSAMQSLATAVSKASTPSVPSDITSPGNYNYNMSGVASNVGSQTSGGNAGSGNVVVNLHNQTGRRSTPWPRRPGSTVSRW